MKAFLTLALLLVSSVDAAAQDDVFVAVSLMRAREILETGSSDVSRVRTLGGITQIIGAVADRDSGDIVVVGRCDTTDVPPTLDDLVVALRARYLHHAWPLVSIDPPKERGLAQGIRFEAGVAGTAVGAQLLAADELLKRVALGHSEAEGLDIESYFDRCVTARRERRDDVEIDVGVRFWFVVADESPLPVVSASAGVFVASDLQLELRAQVVGSSEDDAVDQQAEEFVAGVNNGLDAALGANEVWYALPMLFDLGALADGIHALVQEDELEFWLHDYDVEPVSTPTEHPTLARRDADVDLSVEGGIELRVIASKLANGETMGFRDAVLRSRPADGPLAWRVPLSSWMGMRHANVVDAKAHDELPTRELGSSLFKAGIGDSSFLGTGTAWAETLPQPIKTSTWGHRDSLPYRPRLPSIGGIMLSGTASVEGVDGADVANASIDPTTGAFSLVVAGEDLTVPEVELRKFVTALWAVYFGESPPGISIDPAGAGSPVQLVRQIGEIDGSNLARVLLNADYRMKQFAIGADYPPVEGFKSVDQLIGELGVEHLGAGRRFWFVPKDMKFRRCGGTGGAGDTIVFEGGRIELLTEKLFRDRRGVSDPVDEAFSRFFTTHFWEIAEVEPVFKELFDYARYTSMSAWLKESGVPLTWFLLSHRHLLLREDIESTVPTLTAKSESLRGLQWEGGVNLSVDMSRKAAGRYVLDEHSAKAIRRASARFRRTATDLTAAEKLASPYSVEIDRSAWSVVPSSNLGLMQAGGAGRPTFHTDVAFRNGNEPGLELVRFSVPGRTAGRFGSAWDLLLPCTVRAAGEGRTIYVPAANGGEVELTVPGVLVITDALDAREETFELVASDDLAAEWLPPDPARSRYRRVVLTAGGGCIVEEKSGCLFAFDGALRMTRMQMAPGHWTDFEWSGDRIVAASGPGGVHVALDYGRSGRISEIRSSAGKVKYRYIGGELVAVVQDKGRRIVFIYDEDGCLEEVIVR